MSPVVGGDDEMSPWGVTRARLHAYLWPRVKVADPIECFEWQGWLDRQGYGNTIIGKRGQHFFVHRAAFWLAHSYVPEVVCHACDNRRCVNPLHLFGGGHADNVRDMTAKDRVSHGDKHVHAKLTSAQAVEIFKRYARGGISGRQLAEEYGISESVVRDIRTGVTWRRATHP